MKNDYLKTWPRLNIITRDVIPLPVGGDSQARLRGVLASIANLDRLRILNLLEKGPQRLVDISKFLEVTPQEAKRHVTNLVDNGLIGRDASGSYFITGLGSIALGFTKALEKALKSRKFFMGHTFNLPSDLLMTLLQSSLIDRSLKGAETLNSIISRAREKLYIHVRGLSGIYHKLEPKIGEVRDFKAVLEPKDLEALKDAIKSAHLFKLNTEPESFNMVINEKEAILFLKSQEGIIDFNQALYGRGGFRWMCEMLFEQVWSKSKYIPELLSSSSTF